MNGAVAVPGWIVIVLLAAAGLAIFLGAYTPKYRKATKEVRQEFEAAQKRRIEQLEEEKRLLEEENKGQRDRITRLETKMEFMEHLVLGKCASCEIDDEHGGCRYCTRHLLYGQQKGQ